MKSIIKVKPSDKNNDKLKINRKTAEKLGIADKKRVGLCFGSRKHWVKVRISDNVIPNQMIISFKVIEYLHLPIYPDFEVRLKRNNLLLGPFIGILVSKKDESFNERRLRRLLVYLISYQRLHGSIIAFALDKVDTDERLIEGYCYNPEEDRWQRGVFPYPGSIYRRIGIKKKWRNHFISEIGDKLFNNYFFDKWETYRWFTQNHKVRSYLPQTKLYRGYQDIEEMLNKYEEIFIKPVSGMQGARIMRISKGDNEVIFQRSKSDDNKKVTFNGIKEAKGLIQDSLKVDRYLIQQAIDIIKYDKGAIDFRMVMQKGITGNWECNKIVIRYGGSKSIVSNISRGGRAYKLSDLKELFDMTNKDIYILKERLEAVAYEVCSALDRFGMNCGTLGLDLGLDKNDKIWLIEVNSRDPDPTIALDVNDRISYYEIKTKPMFYAKYLAGFSSRG